ncbi:hypothetical protein CCR96_01040 [Halochromatium roseum]|nr:hypothetical protein [Halochromatium roseum]
MPRGLRGPGGFRVLQPSGFAEHVVEFTKRLGWRRNAFGTVEQAQQTTRGEFEDVMAEAFARMKSLRSQLALQPNP